MKYKKGTQAMLDAAKDDATLLPYDTLFLWNGLNVVRNGWLHDNSHSVYFSHVENMEKNADTSQYLWADKLSPSKKSKPKKWQNGTQAQLDAAKDDARLIPKKTYFTGPQGYIYHRGTSIDDNAESVLMIAFNGSEVCASGMLSAGDLYD